VTFKNADQVREALRLLPAELILVETDAPYLAPAPYRGRPNASYLVPVTVRAMAETRGDDLGALCAVIAANAEAVFGPF
jgi:TatD DNase family protein